MTLLDELAALVRELDAANIEYALVGGLAVAIWGAPRATQDIDFLVRPESLAAALTAVEARGYRLRALLMTFKDGMQLQRVSKLDAGALLPQDALDIQNLEELDR